MALSATPSSIPAKIKNSVAAKYQVKSNKAANPTTPMPPTDIAHARSSRAARRSFETATLIPFQVRSDGTLSSNAPGDQAQKARRFDAGVLVVQSDQRNGIAAGRGAEGMNFKWVGPLALLAALVIGDQIRINRPGHKYRLTVEVQTPEGVKSSSGVMAVHPDRSYSRGGHTLTRGDAVFVDLGGGKNLVALLAHIDDKSVDLDGVNYVALRAYNAAGRKVSFNEMNRATGAVPVKGALIPILVTFTDPGDPGTARTVPPDELEARLGKGF